LHEVAPGVNAVDALARPEDWRALDENVARDLFALRSTMPASDAVEGKISSGVELLSLALLSRFLEDPALAEAQWRVGLQVDEYEEEVEVTTETTEVGTFETHNRVVEAMRDAWRVSVGSEPERELCLRENHAKAYETASLKGEVPTGVVGDIVRDIELSMLENVHGILRDVLAGPAGISGTPPVLHAFFVGEQGEGDRLPSLDVSQPDKPMALRARITDVIFAWEHLYLPVFAMSEKSTWRDFVRGFLSVAVLSASGVSLPSEFTVLVLPVRRKSDGNLADSQIKRFRTPDPQTSLAWLKLIVAQWKESGHDYYLPVTLLDALQLRAQKSGSRFSLESLADSQEAAEFLWGRWKQERVDPPDDSGAPARRRLRQRLANPAAIEPPENPLLMLRQRFEPVITHEIEKSSTQRGSK
jgi:hypothetical protein